MMSREASEDTVIIQYVTESGDVIQTVGDGGTVVIDEQCSDPVTLLDDGTAVHNEAEVTVTQQVILLEDSEGNVTQQTIVMETDAADEDGSRANGDTSPIPEEDSTSNQAAADGSLLPPADTSSSQSPKATLDATEPPEEVAECEEPQTEEDPNHQVEGSAPAVEADAIHETPKIPTKVTIKSHSDIEGEDEEIISLINQISENDTSQLKNQVEPDTKFPANFLADDQSEKSEDRPKSHSAARADQSERIMTGDVDRPDRRVSSERVTKRTEDGKANAAAEDAARSNGATPVDDDVGLEDERADRSSESDREVEQPVDADESPMENEPQADDDSPEISNDERSPRENLTNKLEILGSANLTDTNAAKKRILSKETVRKTYPLRRQTRDHEDDVTDSSFTASSPGFSFWSDSDTEQKKRGSPRKYPRTSDVVMDKGQPKDFSMFGFEYSDAQQGTDPKEVKTDEPGINSTSRPDEVAVDSSQDSEVAGKNAVKRKSPRKLEPESKQSSLQTGQSETTSDDEAEPPIKRGRGRPRKSLNKDTASDLEEAGVGVRRRSSRICVAEGKIVEKKNEEADSVSEDESEPEDFEKREKVNKKRVGSPRVYPENGTDIETKVVEKRKRGRPFKSESQASLGYNQTERQTKPRKSLKMSTGINRSPRITHKPVENTTKTTAASRTGDFSWIYEQSMAREKDANVSGDSTVSPSSSAQKKITSQDNIFEKMSDTSATSYRLDPTSKVNTDVGAVTKEDVETEKLRIDSSDKSQDQLKSPKAARKFFFLSNEPKKKEKKPILTKTGKNIGVKFNMKEMRFTVSRESRPSPVSPFGGWQGQGAVSKAYQRKMEGLHNMQSSVQEKEALLEKKEYRLKIFDRELDKRSCLLKTREGKLARAEQQVHNKERSVDLWEKRLQHMEQKLSTEGSERDSLAELQKEYNRKIKELEFKTQDVQNLEKRLKTKEDRLKNFEASIQRLKQEMGRKQVENMKQEKANKGKEKLLAATEQELTALSLDLSEKFEYLQLKEQEAADQPVSKKDKQAIQNQHSITQFLKRVQTSPKETSETETTSSRRSKSAGKEPTPAREFVKKVTSPKETPETERPSSRRSKSTGKERIPARKRMSLSKLTSPKNKDVSGKKTLAEKPTVHKSQATTHKDPKTQISSPKVKKRTLKDQTPKREISSTQVKEGTVKRRTPKERTPGKEKMSSSTFSPKNNPSGKKKPAEKVSLPKRAPNAQEEPKTPMTSPRVRSRKQSSAKKKTSSPKTPSSNRTPQQQQQQRTPTGRFSYEKQPAREKGLTKLKERKSSTPRQTSKPQKALSDSKAKKDSSKPTNKPNRRLTLPAQPKKSKPPSTRKAEMSRRLSAPVTRKHVLVLPEALRKRTKKSISPAKKTKTPSKETKTPSREKRKSLPTKEVSTKVQPGKRKRSSLAKDDSLPSKRRR